jgi:hypothetical protein
MVNLDAKQFAIPFAVTADTVSLSETHTVLGLPAVFGKTLSLATNVLVHDPLSGVHTCGLDT